MITESWLNAGTPDSLLDPQNKYYIIRCDRVTTGGGVCAFVSKCHSIIAINVSELYPELEICCFDMISKQTDSRRRVLVVYRPPPRAHSVNIMPRLVECLDKYSAVNYQCIIAGDFNCACIDWQNLNAPEDGTHNLLFNFVVEHGLTQIVNAATRSNNLLDIVLTSEPLSIHSVNVFEPFGTSDHCQIDFTVFSDRTGDEVIDYRIKRYDWSKADFDSMSDYIGAMDWFALLSVNLTPDSLWAAFTDVLQKAVDLYVPVKYVSSYANVKCKRWYPAELRRAIIRKRCLWRHRKANPHNASADAAYRDAERECRQLLRAYEIKREQKIIDGNNVGGFFSFVNRKLSCKRGLGAFCTEGGDVITKDDERSELLNNYFASVCTKDDGAVPIFDRAVPADATIESVDFTPESVYAAIRKLKTGGSSGPDGFPPVMFKNLAGSLTEPLALMFKSFMSVGKIPAAWSHAIVTPVFKSGPASSVSNYRPISLTCVASKLMERVVSSSMLTYLRQHGVISRQQHGFLSGRSTSSNLLETLNDWTLSINDKKSVGAVYIDYAKAFDSVCHAKLITKLAGYGIGGQLLKWIECFLHCRTQQTRVGHTLSSSLELTSGVVQGSVIGPLLFVLFTNDVAKLFNCNNCTCKLFADDLKLYSVLETDSDCDALQNKLSELCDWSDKWQLTVSIKKCNMIYVGSSSFRPAVDFNLRGNILPVVNSCRDLGIIVDSNLTFNAHINQVVSRAFIRANLIHKCFMSRSVINLKRAFVVYVRPLLEYASCVWSPHHLGQIKQIESVQRRFTKRLPGYAALDYRSRLLKLGLESLEIRRLRQDLIFVYKMLFELVDLSFGDFFQLTETVHSCNTRGHDYKLFVNFSRIDNRKHFFSNRVIKPWNNLPAKAEHFRNLTTFKRFIRSTDLSEFVTLGF